MSKLEPWVHYMLKDDSIHYFPEENLRDFICANLGNIPSKQFKRKRSGSVIFGLRRGPLRN